MHVFRFSMPKGKNNPPLGNIFASQGKRKNGKGKTKKERENEKMELLSIFEVVRIKQEIKESPEPFAAYVIRSPEDTQYEKSGCWAT
jgi:hypothetical protein